MWHAQPFSTPRCGAHTVIRRDGKARRHAAHRRATAAQVRPTAPTCRVQNDACTAQGALACARVVFYVGHMFIRLLKTLDGNHVKSSTPIVSS